MNASTAGDRRDPRANKDDVSMEDADGILIEALLDDVLDCSMLEDAVDEAVQLLEGNAEAEAARVQAIDARKSTDQTGVADEQKSVTRQIAHARATRKRLFCLQTRLEKGLMAVRAGGLIVFLFAAVACSHPVHQTVSRVPKPATTVQTLPDGLDAPKPQKTPVGSWAGVVKAITERTANMMGPTMNVAVTITQAGPVYEGDCSQDGTTDVVKTINREMIEDFRLIAIDPAGQIVLMEGRCGKLRFTLAYHPAYDRITGVSWAEGSAGERHYFGEMTRQFTSWRSPASLVGSWAGTVEARTPDVAISVVWTFVQYNAVIMECVSSPVEKALIVERLRRLIGRQPAAE